MTIDDYKAALETTRKLMKNMRRQNKHYRKALEKYAFTDWRTLTLIHKNRIAKEALNID